MLIGTETLNLTPTFDPFAYQLNAVEEVKGMEYAALFHEQGLGKTKIALDLALLWLKGRVLDTVIIITKKGLIQNWKKEISIHTKLSFAVLDGYRVKNTSKYNKPFRLYLTHYEAVINNQKNLSLLLKTRRVGVILDEAHYMKNPDGRVAKALFQLGPEFKHRIIMTGTPVANRPYDIWALIYFLDQGKSLGANFKAFKSKFDLPANVLNNHDEGYERSLEGIFETIEPFTIRETKRSSELKLPQKTLRNYEIEMRGQQADLYSQYKSELYVQIIRDGSLMTDDVNYILKQMMRLVQVASNPMMVDESYNERPCKVDALELLIGRVSLDEKIIVWTNFIENSDYLASLFSEMGSLKIHGKMDMNARNHSVERFLQDPSKRLLVATPGAAKEGLTLTVANHAIFFDRNFSLNDWLQAQDRIHRIRQERPCEITHLLARESIDCWIDRLLICKKRFAELVQGDKPLKDDNLLVETEITNIINGVLQP